MRCNGSEEGRKGGIRRREGCCASRGWKYEPVRKRGRGRQRSKIFFPASGRSDLQSSITRCLVERSIKTNVALGYSLVDIEEDPTAYPSIESGAKKYQ